MNNQKNKEMLVGVGGSLLMLLVITVVIGFGVALGIWAANKVT